MGFNAQQNVSTGGYIDATRGIRDVLAGTQDRLFKERLANDRAQQNAYDQKFREDKMVADNLFRNEQAAATALHRKGINDRANTAAQHQANIYQQGQDDRTAAAKIAELDATGGLEVTPTAQNEMPTTQEGITALNTRIADETATARNAVNMEQGTIDELGVLSEAYTNAAAEAEALRPTTEKDIDTAAEAAIKEIDTFLETDASPTAQMDHWHKLQKIKTSAQAKKDELNKDKPGWFSSRSEDVAYKNKKAEEAKAYELIKKKETDAETALNKRVISAQKTVSDKGNVAAQLVSKKIADEYGQQPQTSKEFREAQQKIARQVIKDNNLKGPAVKALNENLKARQALFDKNALETQAEKKRRAALTFDTETKEGIKSKYNAETAKDPHGKGAERASKALQAQYRLQNNSYDEGTVYGLSDEGEAAKRADEALVAAAKAQGLL